jgi:hypothetical protein
MAATVNAAVIKVAPGLAAAAAPRGRAMPRQTRRRLAESRFASPLVGFILAAPFGLKPARLLRELFHRLRRQVLQALLNLWAAVRQLSGIASSASSPAPSLDFHGTKIA